MLDQLTNLVKQNADDAIINNPAIPNEKNEEVINEASNSIAAGLQNCCLPEILRGIYLAFF